MASSAKTASTATNVDRFSGPAWTNLSNALTDDNNYAEITVTTADQESDWAAFTNWGFNISPLATIDGVLFTYKAAASTWDREILADEFVLWDNGGTNTNQTTISDSYWDPTLQTFTVGSPSDKWGTDILQSPGITLDAATINSSVFGIGMYVKAGDVYGASSFSGALYYVSLSVYYSINGIRYGNTEIKDVRLGTTQVKNGFFGSNDLNTSELTLP